MARKYRGRLTLEQIADGLESCVGNARRLFDDAATLIDAGSMPGALSCLLGADQEMGKINALTGMARTHSAKQAQWRDRWNSFYDHQHKSAAGAVLVEPPSPRQTPVGMLFDLVNRMVGASGDETLRQRSLYVDFDAEAGRWASPADISNDLVLERFDSTAAALGRVEAAHAQGMFSLRSLQLQREIYSPVTSWAMSKEDWTLAQTATLMETLREIHLRYYREMLAEGFLADIDDGEEVFGVTFGQLRAEGG